MWEVGIGSTGENNGENYNCTTIKKEKKVLLRTIVTEIWLAVFLLYLNVSFPEWKIFA